MDKFKHESTGTYQEQKWVVWGLDVWGHAPEECEYDDEDRPVECCSFTVNDRSKRGTVMIRCKGMRFNVGTEHEFESFSPNTDDVTKALVDAEYFVETAEIEADGESEFMLEVNRKSDGRPLLQLEREKEPS